MASSSATNYGVYQLLSQLLGHYYSDGTERTVQNKLSNLGDLIFHFASLEIHIITTALYYSTATITRKNWNICHWTTHWIGVISLALTGPTTTPSQTLLFQKFFNIHVHIQNHRRSHHRVCHTANLQIHLRIHHNLRQHLRGQDHQGTQDHQQLDQEWWHL